MKTYKMNVVMSASGRVIALISARRRKEIILLIGVTRLFGRRERGRYFGAVVGKVKDHRARK